MRDLFEAPIPESERWRERDLRNAEGKLVATMRVLLGEAVIEGRFYGKQLSRLEFVPPPSSGRSESVDAMRIINPHGMSVAVSDITMSNFSFDRKAQSLFCPPLRSAIDLVVLFHELGHAAQSQEDAYQQVFDMADKMRFEISDESLCEVIPLVKGVDSNAFEKKLAERRRIKEEIAILKGNVQEQDTQLVGDAGERCRDLEKKLDVLENEFALFTRVPMKLLEQDAWRRAFEWLRLLRDQYGINLLDEFLLSEQEMPDSGNRVRIFAKKTERHGGKDYLLNPFVVARAALDTYEVNAPKMKGLETRRIPPMKK